MKILFAGVLLCSLSLAGCDALDTKEDLNLTDEMMATRRYQMFDWGYRVYEHIPYGFTAIDGNLFAAVSDEAQYVTTFSSTQRFNEGSWSAYYNPDDCYTSYYNGIYAAHDYLDKSVDYRYILGMHRDIQSMGESNCSSLAPKSRRSSRTSSPTSSRRASGLSILFTTTITGWLSASAF